MTYLLILASFFLMHLDNGGSTLAIEVTSVEVFQMADENKSVQTMGEQDVLMMECYEHLDWCYLEDRYHLNCRTATPIDPSPTCECYTNPCTS